MIKRQPQHPRIIILYRFIRTRSVLTILNTVPILKIVLSVVVQVPTSSVVTVGTRQVWCNGQQ